jgi:phosphonopyruvate decarboxylase
VIRPADLLAALTSCGYRAFTGVPCSYLKGVFATLEDSGSYTAAPHEGVALAISAGHELAGTPTAVFLQNSGVGNLLDPLTSLVMPYEIPALLFVSLRGWPTADDDEPHHAVMGRSTAAVLDAIGVETALLNASYDDLTAILDRAVELRDRGRPFAILTAQGTFGPYDGGRPRTPPERLPSPETVIGTVIAELPEAFVISTTGLIGREMYRQDDSERRFYMQGSMGHAIGIGMGRALSAPQERVVVLDGDGSALMHLGASALVGGIRPPNLIHVVLDNGTYDSTGGQSTMRANTDWEAVGRGLAYRFSAVCKSSDELADALGIARIAEGPALIACRVDSHRKDLPRISERWTNPEIFARARDASPTTGDTAPRQEWRGP